MSFGKRGLDKQIPQEPAKPAEPVETARSSFGLKPPSLPTMPKALMVKAMGLVAGIAVMVGLYSAYVSVMKSAGRELDRQWDIQQSKTLHAQPDLQLLATSEAKGWRLGKCTLRAAPDATTSFAPGQYKEREEMHFGLVEAQGGDESVALLNRADFLDCIARSEKYKLCDASVRSAFVDDVLKFYREHEFVSKSFARTRSEQEKFGLINAFSEPGAGSSEFKRAADMVDDEVFKAQRTVVLALKHVATAGVVSKSDFGFFAPAVVKDAMDFEPVETSACP
jgi:hypothetical protein